MTTAKELEAAYLAHTPKSRARTQDARAVFPGGDTRASAHYGPYPVFMERGSGCRIVDLDGHEYVDFMNNFTSLIHGHAHPEVVKAVTEQVALGSAYAAPSQNQLELGQLLIDRVPSIERLRFTSSGSEGTLMAIRAARAFTGRPKIIKMEGGYHGSYDLAEVSLVPIPEQAGPLESPTSLPVDRSIAPSALDDAIIAPFNEPDMATALIEKHASEVAAVIVEPVMGSMGMLPATSEFLFRLRDATAQHGCLLILDEVITLRLSSGGAQAQLGVEPDLTAMGKIIGGGLPIGAFGGRADIVDQFSPDQADSVMHASTFSGNPLSMAAGGAAMRALGRDDYDRINALGDRLRVGLTGAFRKAGVRGCAVGSGSLLQLNFTEKPPKHAREALQGMLGTGRITRLLHLGQLRRGVFAASRGMYCVSTAMGEAEIEHAIAALGETLEELKPVMERDAPALLA